MTVNFLNCFSLSESQKHQSDFVQTLITLNKYLFLSRHTDNALTSLSHILYLAYVSLPQRVTGLQMCK